MTLVEFQALIHEDGRIAATQEAIIMRHSIGLGHPCDIEAARKSFELLNPDTARKDTGV